MRGEMELNPGIVKFKKGRKAWRGGVSDVQGGIAPRCHSHPPGGLRIATHAASVPPCMHKVLATYYTRHTKEEGGNQPFLDHG